MKAASRRHEEKRVVRKEKRTSREIGIGFIRDCPAMRLGEWLVVTDLHLGITREMYEAGVSLPSQVQQFVQRIHDLKVKAKTKRLVLLGDVKHKVPGVSWQEEQEIPEFLSRLDFEEIVIIKGNHDGGIEQMIPPELKNKVKVKKGLAVGGYYFTHGHRKITGAALHSPAIGTIIIGHNQPAVLFRDALAARYTEPVWVRGPLAGKCKGHELIIVPAFNELRGHTLVNRDRLIGPIAKALAVKHAHAFLLDGTDLGTLESLKIKGE